MTRYEECLGHARRYVESLRDRRVRPDLIETLLEGYLEQPAFSNMPKSELMRDALVDDRLPTGVQPDPAVAAMVSECAELLEKYGDYELGDL